MEDSKTPNPEPGTRTKNSEPLAYASNPEPGTWNGFHHQGTKNTKAAEIFAGPNSELGTTNPALCAGMSKNAANDKRSLVRLASRSVPRRRAELSPGRTHAEE